MAKYLALSIGPVIKILLQARKTRELWACSFLLSGLMQRLTEYLDPDKENLLIPAIPDDVKEGTLYGAGIYPDRLFMKADRLTEAHVHTAVRMSLESLARDCMLPAEATDEKEVNAAIAFWERFFRIRFVVAELPDIGGGKLSRELSPILETMELEDTCFPEEPQRDYLHHLFMTERLFRCELVKKLRGENRGRYEKILSRTALFPATHEIASFELFEKEPDLYLELNKETDDEKNELFYRAIEEKIEYKPLKAFFKPRHKYFCIVQADGDNIGEAVKKLSDEKAYRNFSGTLARYGQEAAGIINDYGGKPIYIGGDDLLFLAPVRSSEGSLFDLIDKLDKAFPKSGLHSDASLSFGLNIVYYKFPLFEAIGDAYEILKAAKDFGNEKKNAVSFRFTKHSGNAFQGVFSKTFLKETSRAIEVFEAYAPKGRTGLVSSLIYKLFTLRKLIESLAQSIEPSDSDLAEAKDIFSERLDNLLDAFFNEWEKEPGFAKQRDAVKALLVQAYVEKGAKQEDWTGLFYAAMRLIQFIVSPSEQNKYDTENIAATAR
jgi:CRISPR-associated protein Cmr2